MGIILDILVVVILLFCALRASGKPIYRTVANILVLLAVFAGSVLGSFALRPVIQSVFIEPSYAKSVAADMADMVSSPALDDPYLTVAKIDLPALMEKQSAQFSALAESYGVTTQKILEETSGLSGAEASEKALKTIVTPAARDVSWAITYALLFILLLIILKSVGKKLYEKREMTQKMTRNTALGFALGLVTGLLWSYTLIAVLVKCFYPYSFGALSVIGLHGGVDSSFLTRILILLNPF